jgi:hypothetical protein
MSWNIYAVTYYMYLSNFCIIALMTDSTALSHKQSSYTSFSVGLGTVATVENGWQSFSKLFPAQYIERGQCSGIPSYSDQFTLLIRQCQDLELHYSRRERCNRPESVHLSDGTHLSIYEEIGNGGYAIVYATSRIDIVFKLSLHESLCTETAALTVLNTTSIAPRIFHLAPSRDPISPYCQTRMIVMEKRGDIDWDRMYSAFHQRHPPSASVTLSHLSRLLKTVSTLHSLGFVHRDIHDENVRLSLSYPSGVWLVDFGKVRLVNEKDRKNDLQAILKLVPSALLCTKDLRAIISNYNIHELMIEFLSRTTDC